MSQSANNPTKLLWVNPSFLDYRIPLYGELNSKLGGQFHLLYSKERIPDRCHVRINEVLGKNAHFLEHERRIKFGNSEAEFANTSVSIPIPSGLYGMIKSIKPDAIIAEGFFQFTPWAVWYSFWHRISLYIAYERTAHTERNCPWWRKIYRRFIGLFVDGYIANGQLTKEYLISQGVKPERIFTGGMCADSANLREMSGKMSQSDKDLFKKSINISDIRGLRYIYVGQLIQRKGVNLLIDAWRKHLAEFPNDQLLIVGGGEFIEKYRDAASFTDTIVFTGGVDYSQIYKYYAISDVFVIPTLEDNWSLVVPEAMACSLPVACSIYNGCHPELVLKNYNGVTFDPLSVSSTAEALAYFHSIPLDEFGQNSSELESQYNPSRTADNILYMLNG